MNNWIDVPDLKHNDIVVIPGHGACRVDYVTPDSKGNFIVGFWTSTGEFKEKTFTAVTSLQKADKQ